MFSLELKPSYGDIIRVNRGLYYHYGIYIDDENVVQFGCRNGIEVSPQNARVIITTLAEFLKEGILETRTYNETEMNKKREPVDVVNYALAHLGEAGYDLINNNCEHFVNRCVFDESYSEQVNDVMSLFRRFVH